MCYTRTRWACYTALVVQSVANNLAPILFVVFQDSFHISFESLGRLVFINFCVQLLSDLVSINFSAKIGAKNCLLWAHIFTIAGLICMSVLPSVFPDPYIGLTLAVILYAAGGGLIEVLASPVLEALPSKSKAASMSLLHSFYSWGQVVVILLSTLFLKVFGSNNWRILPIVWSIIPFINIFVFLRAPFVPIVKEGKTMSAGELFKDKRFLLFLIIMLCAGAAELSMSQWASLFAQKGLGVDKFIGDLAGPCLFAIFMGLSRVVIGILGDHIPIQKLLFTSALACVVCYVTAALAENAMLSLLGCALCGGTVAALWPGTYSLGSRTFPQGGAVLFGFLAMFGDTGCSIGPWLTGAVSDFVKNVLTVPNAEQIGLRCGILVGGIFPLVLVICLLFEGMKKRVK